MDSIEIVPFEAAFQKEVEAMFVDGLVSQGPTSLQKWFTTRKLEQDMGDIHKHYIDEDSKRRSPFGGLMFFIAVDRNNEKNCLAGFVGMTKSTYGNYSSQEAMYEGMPGGPPNVGLKLNDKGQDMVDIGAEDPQLSDATS